MELLELASILATRGGWTAMNQSCYPNDSAYRSAKSRLHQQGLVASRSTGGHAPKLVLTEQGKRVIPAYFEPEKRWNQPWNKIWYMLVYDVPEKDRSYRDVLRRFLKAKRLGQLQQSVWITPEDIRPDFDDLVQAANIDAFAYLFESRTVLGLSSQSVVESAWNFNRLQDRQEHFRAIARENTQRLQSGSHSPEDLASLSRMTLSAYHSAMIEDPLLPTALLPRSYAGKGAYASFTELFRAIDAQL